MPNTVGVLEVEAGGSWEAVPLRCLRSEDHVRTYPTTFPESVWKGKEVLQCAVLRAALCSCFCCLQVALFTH